MPSQQLTLALSYYAALPALQKIEEREFTDRRNVIDWISKLIEQRAPKGRLFWIERRGGPYRGDGIKSTERDW